MFTLYLLLSSFQFVQVIVPYLGIPPDKYFLVDGRWREAPSFFQFYLQPHNNQRKYISNKQSYAYIRRTSDRLCKEHGLSVVKPGQSKGKSYAEWDAQRKGTSWKAKLKVAIDVAIPQAKDFDDFLRLMQAQGYEIKPGKFISFRAPGQERFTRCKTLGESYTGEAIKERIKGRVITRAPKERKGISLRIDLENSIKA